MIKAPFFERNRITWTGKGRNKSNMKHFICQKKRIKKNTHTIRKTLKNPTLSSWTYPMCEGTFKELVNFKDSLSMVKLPFKFLPLNLHLREICIVSCVQHSYAKFFHVYKLTLIDLIIWSLNYFGCEPTLFKRDGWAISPA